MNVINSIIKALSCESLYKYVLNDCSLHSKCSECCDLEISTNAVDIPDSPKNKDDNEMEYSIDIGNWGHYRQGHNLKNN